MSVNEKVLEIWAGERECVNENVWERGWERKREF